MKRKTLQCMGALLLVGSVAASCSRSPTEVPSNGKAVMNLVANVGGTAIAMLVVDVAAPDIVPALVFNIPVTGTLASGTVTVPAGSNRAITMSAFDAGGVETHTGAATVNVQAGTNMTISIALVPLTGGVPINATLGTYRVTVTPSPDTVAMGDTIPLTLTASIADVNGKPVVGTVAWATRDPGVATVDSTGLVTPRGAGTTSVLATFNGAAGIATITVTP